MQEVNVFSLVVQVAPKPKPRARVTCFGTFTPTDYKEWEDALAERVKAAWGSRSKLTGAIALSAIFTIPVPVKLSKKERAARLFSACHTIKPDLDNFLKGLNDALNHAGVWGDDCQVAHITASKQWGEVGEIAFSVEKLA